MIEFSRIILECIQNEYALLKIAPIFDRKRNTSFTKKDIISTPIMIVVAGSTFVDQISDEVTIKDYPRLCGEHKALIACQMSCEESSINIKYLRHVR